ncbi:DUF2812 domain-containing protein [Neobacillus vireti]|uniref:DUF2812 domain-containing protein n=1 Tax=Neobacillus vireti LMG 21834 TaxID=1131730 RepID=A0AB94IJ56_9BACI|nr:DUF2812 domain-containing protein [Neobacillus vireti]ETI67089.1 hypothetical protein BAVI_19279 [Neobacillus vireti LMG 21834]KLT19703.1 hypothetical protein AA980_03730 [Neobacillus vireti]
MIKKVLRPFWSYDVQKTEKWLIAMAEQGYFLVKINRVTRSFFFQQGEPKKLTYRIGFDKMQGESLSRGLLAEGWTKVLRAGHWFVTSNEKPMEQIKTSSIREGIIKHNRIIMYIFGGIVGYFSIAAMLFLSIFGMIFFASDSQVEVVESPYWIFTYLYFGAVIAILVLALYSVIKIHTTNKNLIKENSRDDLHFGMQPEGTLSKAEEKQLKCSGKLIAKRKLGWMYAPDKLEQWLEEMEEQGYNLYRVSKTGTVFHFFIGRPRKVCYCADYQNIADESYFDIHREAGWKSVFKSFGSLQKWSIWVREYSEGKERPQIYSDKSNQLKHARKIAIAYSCLFLPLIIAHLLNLGIGFDLFIHNTVDKMRILTLIIMVIVILSFGSFTIRTWLYYFRLKKTI